MEHLNYQHLERFWAVVREGGVTRASQKLHVSQPTVSAQVRTLEQSLGQRLFARSGRGLVLTDFGRAIYRYADQIFGLGRDLMDTARGRAAGHPLRLTAGVAMVVPKLIACRILEPALKLPGGVHLECLEDTPEQLLAQLALHHLDLVLADAPVGPTVKVRAFNHLLGECGVSVLGRPDLARAHRRGFPASLDGAPFLLARANSALRRSMEDWFDKQGVHPLVVGSFDDSALLKAFGQVGAGLFVAPTAIEAEVRKQYGVHLVGRLDSVREQFYAITVERTLKHPAVLAISEAARRTLFGEDPLPRRRRS
jgi:LysR family transcriptional activator of nhaA